MTTGSRGRRNDRGPPFVVVEKIIGLLAAIVTLVWASWDFVAHFGAHQIEHAIENFVYRMVIGWIGPVAIIIVSGSVLASALRRKHSNAGVGTKPGLKWYIVLAWLFVSTGLLAERLTRKGTTFLVGVDRLSFLDIPVVLCAVLLLWKRARTIVFDKATGLRHKVAVGAVAILAVLIILTVLGQIADALHGAFTAAAPASVPAPSVPVVTSPAVASVYPATTLPFINFPPADFLCVDWFSQDTPPPDAMDQALWKEVLLIAEEYSSWRLCRVGSVQSGAGGIFDVKVFSATSGPEGHILVERDIDGNIYGVFVKPQAGQLYFQQPGGDPLVNWGFPDVDVACGNNGRLVIFRRPDHSIEGISRWSAAISQNTTGILAAYYTPSNIALPLLTELESQSQPLLPARGPVVLAPTGVSSQNFPGGRSVRSDNPTHGALTTARLLSRCAA